MLHLLLTVIYLSNRAAAVMATLMAVTLPAPRRLVSRSLWRLDITVPRA